MLSSGTMSVPDEQEFAIFESDEDGPHLLAERFWLKEIASSNGEARRLIDGGGNKINQQPLPAKDYKVEPSVLREPSGRQRWAQLI